MLDLLDEIESSIKQEKMERQIEEWIRNLRKEADIQVKIKKETSESDLFSFNHAKAVC